MNASAATLAAPRGVRPRRLLMILGIGGAVLLALQYAPWFPDVATRQLSMIIAGLLTVLATAADALRFSSLTRRTKRAIVAAALLAVVVFFSIFRIEWGGDMELQRAVPRQWALNLLRRANVDVGDVIHVAKIADPPLVLQAALDDVPQFLGPRGDGVYAPSGIKLARDWEKQKPRELWRNKVGKGWSSFAAIGGYLFTQEETTDFQYELVTCYDLTGGKLQWAHADAGCYESSLGGVGPRATPTFYEGRLLTVGGLGRLNCLDATTGKVLWHRNPLEESQATMPDWGLSASPLVYRLKEVGPVVVVSAGGNHGNSLHAYRLSDGQEIWKVGNDSPGYCSPMLRTLGGVEQVVLVNWQAVTGHDPATGAELWRYEAETWANGQPKVPQPIVLDDRRVFISAGYGIGSVMLEVTRGDDGKWSVDAKWKSNKLKPKFTNPVVRDGYAYGLDDGAFLVCIDLQDGALKWRSSRGANYNHGQVLLADDLLLVQSEHGDLALVAADPTKYQELGRTTVLPSGTSWNVPVLIGRKLLVRNDLEAALYELPTQ